MGDHTEPLPTPREPTEPLPEPGPSRRARTPRGGDGDRRLWIVAAVLAIVLAFVAGYLVGRGAGEPASTPNGPGVQEDGGPVKKQACVRAVGVGRKALAIQARALANRAALLEATAEGDNEQVARLTAEFRTLGQRFEKVEARLDRLVTRCGG